jgi:small conductance mechanosensitive channel
MFQPDAAAPAASTPPVTAPATPPGSVEETLHQQLGMVQKMWGEGVDWVVTRGPSVLVALILLVVAWIVANIVRRVVIKATTRAKIDITLAKFFGNLAKWGIIVFAVVTCMGTLGINTTSLAAVVGAAGLAIGLALQGNLGNLAAGVLLLVFRPFKIGDSVVVAGQAGVVDGIDLFTTNLDTPDNRRIIVPNNAIFSGVIENQSRHPQRRVDLNVPVSGGVKVEEVQRVLGEAVERVLGASVGALRTPAPAIVMSELAPPTWTLSVWAETTKAAPVRLALVREVKLAVDSARIGPTPPVTEVRVTALPEHLAGFGAQARAGTAS